jgi:D-alanyl-D-alanine carboxypeptidase (penicillin-binding protein 5/6)
VTPRTASRAGVAAAIALALAALALLAPPRAAAGARVPACPAAVGAPSAIVVEVSSDTVACARAPDRRRPIASTTKLMTALLTLERARLGAVFRAARYRALPAESRIGLLPGERMKVADLLRGLLVESANDAAETLAEGVAGSRRAFVRAMNQRARKLGLRGTHYANPVGLDQRGNYSTARDLVTLAIVLRTNRFFKRTVDRPQVTLRSGYRPRTFANRNDLVRRYPWVNGVKTGHTRAAGYVLVGSAYRHGVQLVSAVLGTPSEAARDADTLRLFAYAFRRFERVRAITRGQALASVAIRYRPGARLRLVAARTVRRIVPRGDRAAVAVRAVAPTEVRGPLRRGQPLGRAEVRQGGRLVATVPLLAVQAVPRADVVQRTKSWLAHPGVLLVMAAAVTGSVVLARRRRAGRPDRRQSEAPAA